MSLLSYNCRGVGEARVIVRLTNPKVVFLMEIKSERKRMEEVRLKLGFDNCFVVDCRGK